MPIYEYACNACGHVFDVLQKMDAPLLVDCPECGKPELRKLLSAPNFRLKGGGWYETDFKKDNRRNLADGGAKADKTDKTDKADKADKADGKGGAGKPADKAAGAKTEAKPAAKANGDKSGKTGSSSAKSD